MGPSHYFVLRMGSNPTEASCLGRTGGEFYSLAVVVHRVVPRELPFPLGKVRAKLMKYDILTTLNI